LDPKILITLYFSIFSSVPFLSRKLLAWSDIWGKSFPNINPLKTETKSLKTSKNVGRPCVSIMSDTRRLLGQIHTLPSYKKIIWGMDNNVLSRKLNKMTYIISFAYCIAIIGKIFQWKSTCTNQRCLVPSS
jgi:hypothetical protein